MFRFSLKSCRDIAGRMSNMVVIIFWMLSQQGIVIFEIYEKEKEIIQNVKKRKRKMDVNNKLESWPTDLTEDIIVEILSRLPLRFLLQYRCVCKPWSILPNVNPKLIHMKKNSFSLMLIDGERSLLSLDNGSLSSSLSDDLDGHVKKVRCPFIDPLNCDFKNINIVGSCNGLFYLYREENYFWLWNPCLWNPFTHEFKYLPKPGFPIFNNVCILQRGHGFGYDAKTDDYKCVRIFRYSPDGHSHVHIYSFRSNTWKSKCIPYALITDISIEYAPNGVFCNGALHWFATGRYSDSARIIAFNMADEEIKEIAQPEEVEKLGYGRKHVDMLDGCLCILYTNVYTKSVTFEVWLMKDYGIAESWIKVYNIPQLTSTLETLTLVYLKKIECLKTGEILLEVHFDCLKTAALVLYDPKNERATRLKLYKNFRDSNVNLRSVLYRYVKSLVKLNTDSHAEDNKKKDDQQKALSIRD